MSQKYWFYIRNISNEMAKYFLPVLCNNSKMQILEGLANVYTNIGNILQDKAYTNNIGLLLLYL